MWPSTLRSWTWIPGTSPWPLKLQDSHGCHGGHQCGGRVAPARCHWGWGDGCGERLLKDGWIFVCVFWFLMIHYHCIIHGMISRLVSWIGRDDCWIAVNECKWWKMVGESFFRLGLMVDRTCARITAVLKKVSPSQLFMWLGSSRALLICTYIYIYIYQSETIIH